MTFDFVAAVVAGLVGTVAMTAVMAMGGAMMKVEMDMPMTLGTMFLPRGDKARAAGMALHLMMGVVFFIIYALLFQAFGLSNQIALWGAAFGAVHAFAAGTAFGMMPALHPRMVRPGAAGGGDTVPAPGFMGMSLGGMAPMAVVMVHVVFGVVGGSVYAAVA